MDFDSCFRICQVNGTISITTRKVLDEDLIALLEQREGELFLTGIPKYHLCTPEMLVDLASELGEVYSLRYKIDFSGQTRGYAYLQYINAPLKEAALEYLPMRFSQLDLKIKVLSSNNNRELLLKRVPLLSPWQVYQELRKIYPFTILRVYEYQYGHFIYIIGYSNNDMAAKAHHCIRSMIRKFGPRAHISWLNRHHFLSETQKSHCCENFKEQDKLLGPVKTSRCFIY
ncbi:uncharacterized protein LOC108109784 [Drosophila eugracilis]|uniref:uncharacterized protein LOC108109784 n=1 Tax=Drosophila eugracilis TaxID=29029 RepID=UPI0007E66545|nr:uncharacterized protein LOC108109784 [Drosophila eugracilis]